MAIAYAAHRAVFGDTVGVEEAEALLEWVTLTPGAEVDLAACRQLHPANLQVLMAARPAVCAWPSDSALATWLVPALQPSHTNRVPETDGDGA